MLYNKKNQFFRKIAAKIVGKPFYKKKCASMTRRDYQDESQNGAPYQVSTERNLEAFSSNPNGHSDSPQAAPDSIHVSNKPILTGLIAAKIRCDEWGLQALVPTSPQKSITTIICDATSSSSSSKRQRPPTQRSRPFNHKVMHPSHKLPTAVRSSSMKERREALKTMKQYHRQPSFLPSLYDIDEVDEREFY